MKSLALPVVVLALTAAARAGDPPPGVVPHWSLGNQNGALAGVADVNHDGLPDVVAVNAGGVAARLGTGCGNLGPLIASPTGATERTGSLGDFDGDGQVDVVATAHTDLPVSSSLLQVLLGTGDGSFTLASTHTGYATLLAPGVADMNGDGLPDVIVNGGDMVVFGSNGDGTITQVSSVNLSGQVKGGRVPVADVDLDGDIDAAAGVVGTIPFSNSGAVLLINDGSGHLTAAPVLMSFDSPKDLDLADANGDGWPDVALADEHGFFYFTSHAGLLEDPFTIHDDLAAPPTSVRLLDLDGDGTLELLGRSSAPSPASFTQLTIVTLSNGVHLGEPQFLSVNGLQPGAVADMDGDGLRDLVGTVDLNDDDIAVLHGLGAGGFALPESISGPSLSVQLEAADFTGDGRADLLALGGGDSSVRILPADGAGGLLPALIVPGNGTLLTGRAHADLDGDGDLDLVTTSNESSGQDYVATTWSNDGLGHLSSGPTLLGGQQGVLVLDVNGDGFLDLVFASDAGQSTADGLLIAHGSPGGFLPSVLNAPGHAARAIAAADFDLDGDLDIASPLLASLTVFKDLGNFFGPVPAATLPAFGAHDLAVISLNDDGIPDLVVSPGLLPLVGNGSLGFAVGAPVGGLTGATTIQVADLDLDGQDEVFGMDAGGIAEILEADGAGGLQVRGRTSTLSDGTSIAAIQLDASPEPELVAAAGTNGIFTLLRQPAHPAWCLLPAGVAGAAGVPQIKGLGTLAGNSPVALRVLGAAPLAPAALLVGLSEIDHPLKGGVLVPEPDLLIALGTDADGDINLSASWPAGLPSGLDLFFQAWITDASAAHGLAATPGLQAHTP